LADRAVGVEPGISVHYRGVVNDFTIPLIVWFVNIVVFVGLHNMFEKNFTIFRGYFYGFVVRAGPGGRFPA
jgi:hypothetical protein